MLGLFLKSIYAFANDLTFSSGHIMKIKEIDHYIQENTLREFDTPLHLACKYVNLTLTTY